MNFVILSKGQIGLLIYYIMMKKNPIPRSQFKNPAYAPGVFDLHYFQICVRPKGAIFKRKFFILKMAGWIFLIFCTKLDIKMRKRFIKGNFPKIFGSFIKYENMHF